LSLSEAFANAGYAVKVYGGIHETAVAAAADGADITGEIWNQNWSGANAGHHADYVRSNGPGFTVVFEKDGNVVGLDRFRVRVYPQSNGLNFYNMFSSNADRNSVYHNAYYDYESDYEVVTVTLYREYAEDDQYYLLLYYYYENRGGEDAFPHVTKAVVGHYNSLEAANDEADIKDTLIYNNTNYDSGGYLADYSNGVDFTVFDDASGIYQMTVKTVAGTVSETEEVSSPDAEDPYFYVTDAVNLDTYRVPSDADSYYMNGWQTLLVNKNDNEGDSVDLEKVKPIFSLNYAGSKAFAASAGASAATEQISGVSEADFSKGPVLYSARARDDEEFKQYRVSFVKKEEGAKLFVNGPSGAADEEKSDDNTREIFLSFLNYEDHHDVFIANVGDTELTGLNVTLSDDAQNIELDEYWTVGNESGGDANTTLAAFTTTSKTKTNSQGNSSYSYYGELDNVAKIRLKQTGNGEITGKLTISAGTGDNQESRVIYLTGLAGAPEIVTESPLPNATKFVPYSCVIQTDNTHFNYNTVTFSLAGGRLPDGVTLRRNGEVYGVPTEFGDFTFTVGVDNSQEAFGDSEKEFTLHVLDSTEANVLAAGDLEVSQAVPRTITTAADYEFIVAGNSAEDGDFNNFIDFWIDGEKQRMPADYDARSGSTVITINAQTFRSYGNGDHVIAAEFREGGDVDNKLHSATQVYTLNLGGGGGGGGSSAGGTTPAPTAEDAETKDETASSQDTSSDGLGPAAKFTDISGHWAENAIREAIQRGLFNGVSETSFDPNGTLSRAMIITVLWRLSGSPAPQGNVSFSDLEAGKWYSGPIAWAAENGIVQGYEDGRFGTNDDVSRDQIVTIIFRYAEQSGMDMSGRADISGFADADAVPSWATDATAWAVNAGLIRGRDDNTLSPAAGATRAELATIMIRFLDMQ
jgi:hypothetical protein